MKILSRRQIQLLIHLSERPLMAEVAHHHLRTWKSLVDQGVVTIKGGRAVLTREGRAEYGKWLDARSRERLYVKNYTASRRELFRAYRPFDVNDLAA